MSKNLFSLEGRVAVVVGGTSGIGRVLALGLADAGADVVATGRARRSVDEVAAEIEARGRRTLRIATDVARRASLTTLRDAVLERVRPDRHRRRTAPASPSGCRRSRWTEADWQRIIDTNLTGTLRTYQVFAPPMIARESGRLIGIASLASFVGLQEVSAYTARSRRSPG